MSGLDDLYAQLPMADLAAELGVSEEEAGAATRAALVSLLQGIDANAADPGGEASLLDALSQHGGELDGGIDLSSIDTGDGQQIVDHVFGDNRDAVVDRLGQTQGAGGLLGGGLLTKLLPLLAPLVMAWLSKRMGGMLGGGGGGSTPASADTGGDRSASGGNLRDIMGDVLGRKSSTAAPAAADEPAADSGGVVFGGGGLGDILGDLLGGGRKG